ncbi:hypothetical protein BT63DRAFT_109468 [Microthyrium microscopicum]|uniref:Lytic polysaccharide monooxygenase n=1 Tax=Microthyrium microscopicum TaxID=703497 RepID=A0A6A6TYD3_9PEZI|nr:hypothetical protein BT63DRAFT_109468 [Microthyrium microscopicum]
MGRWPEPASASPERNSSSRRVTQLSLYRVRLLMTLPRLCAVAITYAVEGSPEFKDPTQWKKIYHIPDCFMVNAPPNNFPIPLAGPSGIGKPPLGLAGHHDAPWAHCAMSDSKVAGCIRSYNIPMHGAMKNGNAIFSWVWKNAVTSTNETYMNCAPMTITGAKNDGTWDKLPNLKQALSIFGGNDAEPVPNQPASPAPSPVPTDAANAAKGMPADLYWLGSSNSPAAITSNPVKRRNDGPATGSAIPTVPTAVVAPTSPAAPAAPTSSVAIPAFKRNARPSIGWWTPW